jgi:hypothetical protein
MENLTGFTIGKTYLFFSMLSLAKKLSWLILREIFQGDVDGQWACNAYRLQEYKKRK